MKIELTTSPFARLRERTTDAKLTSEGISKRLDSKIGPEAETKSDPVRIRLSEEAKPTYDRRRRLVSEQDPTLGVNGGNSSKPEVTKEKEGVFGDLDGNSAVDGADLAILLGKFGTEDSSGDLDKNGKVDESDLKLLNEAFKRSTEKNAPGVPEEKKGTFGDLDGNSGVDGADLAILLGKFGTDDSAGDLDKNGIVDETDLKLLNEAFKRSSQQGNEGNVEKPAQKPGASLAESLVSSREESKA